MLMLHVCEMLFTFCVMYKTTGLIYMWFISSLGSFQPIISHAATFSSYRRCAQTESISSSSFIYFEDSL